MLRRGRRSPQALYAPVPDGEQRWVRKVEKLRGPDNRVKTRGDTGKLGSSLVRVNCRCCFPKRGNGTIKVTGVYTHDARHPPVDGCGQLQEPGGVMNRTSAWPVRRGCAAPSLSAAWCTTTRTLPSSGPRGADRPAVSGASPSCSATSAREIGVRSIWLPGAVKVEWHRPVNGDTGEGLGA